MMTRPGDHRQSSRRRDSALHHVQLLDAAARADEDSIKEALESGVNVNVADTSGRTLVTTTIAGDSWESIDSLDASFRPASRLNILKFILSHTEVSLYTLNAPVHGISPLCLAAWLDLSEFVECMVESSCGLIAVNGTDSYGATPLMYAARDGRLQIVRYLLANGGRPDHRDLHHRSAIQHALRHPYILWLCEQTLRRHRLRTQINCLAPLPQPYLDRLVRATSLHIYESERIPLIAQTLRAYTRSTEALVQAVITVDLQHIRSLLFQTSSTSDHWSDLVDLPVLVNLPDSTGWSPIHYCLSAESPSIEVLDVLYRAGADVSLYTTSGQETPLHCLAYKAKPPSTWGQLSSIHSFVRHLVNDLHAPLSATDLDGNTCIHVAAEHGESIDVLMAFLACDLSGHARGLRNARGLTALDIAKPGYRIAFGIKGTESSSMVSAPDHIQPHRASISAGLGVSVHRSSLNSAHSTGAVSEAGPQLTQPESSTLSRHILESLESISTGFQDSSSLDIVSCAELILQTSMLRDRLIAHLRFRLDQVAQGFRDARATFQQILASHRRMVPLAESAFGERFDDARSQDWEDLLRRRTTESGSSDDTAVSDTSYLLVGRKCRSLSDLKSDHPKRSSETTGSYPPLTSSTIAVRGRNHPSTATRILHIAHAEIDSSEIDSYETKQALRKRSQTLGDMTVQSQNSTGGKEPVVSSASKVKAWFLKKLLPEPAGADIVGKTLLVGAEGSAVQSFTSSNTACLPELSSMHPDVSMSPSALSCRRCLVVTAKDLSRIEILLETVERNIKLIEFSLSQAETRLNRMILTHRESLESLRLARPKAAAHSYESHSYLDWPSYEGDHLGATSPSTLGAGRSRAHSVASSFISVSSTLIEDEDDEFRTLRRLLTRKIVSKLDNAEDDVDKALTWLDIVKDILCTVLTRTRTL